jgi:mono/diheme cytochrome c family protein
MVNTTRVLGAAALTLLGAATSAAMQAPAQKVVTTSSGVFTSAQAGRGEQTYMNICVSCHPSGTYTTPAFRAKWNGAPVSELFGLISNTMPKMEPASLTPEEYADSVAYLLKINGAPAGKTELPADIKALRRIRIVMTSGSAKAPAK